MVILVAGLFILHDVRKGEALGSENGHNLCEESIKLSDLRLQSRNH